MKELIVTADDFGLAREVNEAVETAHRNGVLTAASLMVGASAAEDAVARARRLPSLGVGLHIVLIDGRPVLPPSDLPALVDGSGQFRNDMAAASFRIIFDASARRQVTREITAQFEAFAATGLRFDHVDCHKHWHLHPTIGGLVIEIGRRFGMKALRVPSEPVAVLRLVEKQASSMQSLVTALCAARLRALVREYRLKSPDRVFGLAWSGAMTDRELPACWRTCRTGSLRFTRTQATSNTFAGAVPGYRYVDEFNALQAPRSLRRQRAAAYG